MRYDVIHDAQPFTLSETLTCARKHCRETFHRKKILNSSKLMNKSMQKFKDCKATSVITLSNES